MRGLGLYARSANPAGKTAGVGWAPNLRGLRKPVFGSLGCPCKRLGQDDSDLNFGIPSGLIAPGAGGNIANVSMPVNYPASPDSGFTYVPSDTSVYGSSMGPASPYGAGYPSGIVPVLNNPSTSYLSVPTALNPTGSIVTTVGSATSPIGSLSTMEILLGGAGLLVIVLLSGKKR